ncbi:hypothetical protein [Burkholderia lata]|nr:hypothetical protein [Burkholderia lata]
MLNARPGFPNPSADATRAMAGTELVEQPEQVFRAPERPHGPLIAVDFP